MSVLGDKLIEIARDVVRRSALGLSRLDAEQRDLERRLAQVQAERDLLGGAAERLRDFTPTLGRAWQCPACWIERGAHEELSPMWSDNRMERLMCQSCGAAWDVPAGGT